MSLRRILLFLLKKESFLLNDIKKNSLKILKKNYVVNNKWKSHSSEEGHFILLKNVRRTFSMFLELLDEETSKRQARKLAHAFLSEKFTDRSGFFLISR